jgi:uncharacterized protein (DUF1697 family)
MARYAAFLRGINAGKGRTVTMDSLRKAFEGIGFENVATIGASGNIVFDAPIPDNSKVEQTIEQELPARIGFASGIR